MNRMMKERSQRLLLLGIAGCLLYVIGDCLFVATGREPAMGRIGTDQFGFMVRVQSPRWQRGSAPCFESIDTEV